MPAEMGEGAGRISNRAKPIVLLHQIFAFSNKS
jgi:hypothetical protein